MKLTKETEVQVEEVKEKEVAKTDKVLKSPSIKKLTLNELKKESKKLDEQREVLVNIGGSDYIISYDLVFRKTKQRAVLEDMLYFFKEIGAENIDQLEMASAYTSLLIIKHFTSLDVPDAIDEALIMLNLLIDMDSLGNILVELPEDEIVKIYDLLTKTVETLNDNIKMGAKEAELVEEEIQNKELLEFADGDREEAEALAKLAERAKEAEVAEDDGEE